MSKPIRRRLQKPDEATRQIVARIADYVEEQTLDRIRGYLGRGRPLAGIPAQTLSAQWIAAYLEVHGLEDDSRADELRDLGTEFDLRGLKPPRHLVLPEVTRFKERFQKTLRTRTPDPVLVERAEGELEAVCDRLIAEQQWS